VALSTLRFRVLKLLSASRAEAKPRPCSAPEVKASAVPGRPVQQGALQIKWIERHRPDKGSTAPVQ